jgi:hypothetical protein
MAELELKIKILKLKMKFYAQNIYKMMENKIGLPYQC